jgi:CheY-like chemotaxis protein
VDDSVTARALHRAVLEAAGYVVHAASNGRQALEHLRRAAYDVAVCDLAMPEIDGLALTRELRASGDRTPIVLVSAHDTDEDRAQGLAAGANAFLSKRECASGRLLAEVSRVIG